MSDEEPKSKGGKPMPSPGRRWIGGKRVASATAGILGIALFAVMNVGSGNGMALLMPQSSEVSPHEIAAISEKPHVLFRHTGLGPDYGRLSVTALDSPGSWRVSAGLGCERMSFGGSHGICLQADRGVFTTYKAVLFDRALKPRGSIKLDGGPSRTRISRDGRVGAVTVFVVGHAYSASTFSTETLFIDMASGEPLCELEQFATWRDGARFSAGDFNFWGVTFARDNSTFYASLRTAGKTYLVKGDLALRKLAVVHENVECPSLSPDDRLIAFKKRIGPSPVAWRLYLLDLATMTERAVASETRYVDDQVEWLDDAHVLYAIPRPSSATTDVWVAPVDDAGQAHLFLAEAESPIVVR